MKGIVFVIGVGAALGGMAFLYQAFSVPGSYALATASAIQATQVYAEGTYKGVMALACFAFAALCTAGGMGLNENK